MRPPKPLSLPLQLHIKIQKLWGENNTIDWHLHPDVNVITGINGSGKSTLLRLLYDAFQNDFSEFEGTEIFEELMIELNEKKDRFNKKEVNEKEKLTDEEDWNFSDYNDSLAASFYDEIEITYLNTFDILLKNVQDKKNIKTERIKTSLDLLLYEKGIKYVHYLKALDAKSRRGEGEATDIYRAKNRFLAILNDSFKATQKQVKERTENGDFYFEKINTGKILSPFQFSAGEKQFFYLLITALLQDNKPTIFILDEPEIALHPEWQLNLIAYIRELNPNAMVIVATHSPEMLINGWLDKEFMMEELVQPLTPISVLS